MNSIATILLSVLLSVFLSWILTACGCYIHLKSAEEDINYFLEETKKLVEECVQEINKRYR